MLREWVAGVVQLMPATRSASLHPSLRFAQVNSNRPEIVVITGASAGAGRATVREFAAHGAHIGLIARGRDGLEGARREVQAAGGKALVLATDVANPDQVEAAAERVE